MDLKIAQEVLSWKMCWPKPYNLMKCNVKKFQLSFQNHEASIQKVDDELIEHVEGEKKLDERVKDEEEELQIEKENEN